MTRTYCTLFDSQFLARGIVMLRSLLNYDPAAAIRVLAMDEPCAAAVREIFGSNVCITAAALREANPALCALRSREPWAFYATHKPVFMRSVLDAAPDGAPVAFVDADMWFFSDPLPSFAEAARAEIALSPHRLSKNLRHLSVYGAYNAGWIHWRAGETARGALADWEADCFAWCEPVVSQGRFMNQGYLNDWPERYPGVHLLRHPGVNLAPWNLDRHRVSIVGGNILVDDRPLISFHYSGLLRDPNGAWFSIFPRPRRFTQVREAIYAPYLDAVESERKRHPIEGTGTVRSWKVHPSHVPVYDSIL